MCNSDAINPADNPLAEKISKTDITGSADTVQKAFQTGHWGEPLGSQASGFDVLGAGPLGMRGIGGSSDSATDRSVGRTVGSFFAGEGIGQAVGGGATAAATGDTGSGLQVSGTTAAAAGGETGSGLSASGSSGSGLSVDVPAATEDGAQGLIAPAGTQFGGGATTSAIGAGGEILSAGSAMPTFNLSPGTADALGISPNFGGGAGTDTLSSPSPDGAAVSTNAGSGDESQVKKPDVKSNTIMGLKPTTAALLGLSGVQALSKPKQTSADKTLESNSTPAATQANSVISSGGTGSPAWATQKESIDSNIDQQIEEQSQAIIQQAINAGQGADSMVVKQQVNQLKEKLESQRQTLYAQQQEKNVQAALTELGVSNQALSNVSATQFNNSQQAKTQAAQTASMALLLQALG